MVEVAVDPVGAVVDGEVQDELAGGEVGKGGSEELASGGGEVEEEGGEGGEDGLAGHAVGRVVVLIDGPADDPEVVWASDTLKERSSKEFGFATTQVQDAPFAHRVELAVDEGEKIQGGGKVDGVLETAEGECDRRTRDCRTGVLAGSERVRINAREPRREALSSPAQLSAPASSTFAICGQSSRRVDARARASSY